MIAVATISSINLTPRRGMARPVPEVEVPPVTRLSHSPKEFEPGVPPGRFSPPTLGGSFPTKE